MHNLRSHFLPATFFPLKRAKIKLQQWIKINRLRMHVIIQTRDARFYIFLFVYKTWDVDIHGQQYEKAMLRFTPFLNKAQWIFNFFSLVIQCSTINKSHITGFGWPYLPIGITVRQWKKDRWQRNLSFFTDFTSSWCKLRTTRHLLCLIRKSPGSHGRCGQLRFLERRNGRFPEKRTFRSVASSEFCRGGFIMVSWK